MARAEFISIDTRALQELASELVRTDPAAPSSDPAHHRLGDDESTLAYVLTLNAINFGSGWFPVLRKPPGLSGYFTVATALRRQFESHGPWDAEALERLTPDDCARVLGQDPDCAEVAELMRLYAQALGDLGRFLAKRFGGRFAGPVEEARGRAARLVEILAEMPLFRDVAAYRGIEVPFYKRAQITAADLACAFAERGAGRFHDLGRLTAFADNLVPHVLRHLGVLRYDPELARRIDAGERLVAGAPEEVEIRAAAVHAIECCTALVRELGGRHQARHIDSILWQRGGRPDMKAHPRHRTRSTYY